MIDAANALFGGLIVIYGLHSLVTAQPLFVPRGILSPRQARLFGLFDILLGAGLVVGSLMGMDIL